MRFTESLSLLLAAAGTQVAAQSSSTSSPAPSSTVTPDGPETGELGDAIIVANNPPDVVYRATLPESAFFAPAYPDGGNIQGEITAMANPDGEGVRFTLKLSNLPRIGAPLPYHLHVDPVPENGNCTATLAHLDPFIRGEATPCNADLPETCQVGDLSGKFGAIPTDEDTWEDSYVDLYASTLEGIGSFFGNRSIVFHYPNKTRITCANFERVEDGGNGGTSTTVLPPIGGSNTTALPTPGAPTTSAPASPTTSTPVIGAASGFRVGVAGTVVFAAIMFML
ncbi:Superoxide dismutase [Madurella fahalii]|uniref:Superoxide dismutase n=1 Tax=Madurella fahalii TaxID=1157608 RepID=A0ABQ0FZN1_9PEZI